MRLLVDLLVGIISGLISGIITGWVFYRWSGKDLAREAAELRQLNILMLRAMEKAGFVEINRDSSGRPIGFRFRNEIDATAQTTASINADVTRASDAVAGE